MREKAPKYVEELRKVHPTLGASPPDATWGYFEFGPLRIISGGDGEEWEHVSVSCCDRCPTWDEMSTVKDLFWRSSETVLQFHPQRSAYINHHPYTLHLWKWRGENHPLPPEELIGPRA